MIRDAKINFQSIDSSSHEVVRQTSIDPFHKVISMISNLNQCTKEYTVIVTVIDSRQSTGRAKSQQLESLLGALTRRELEVYHLAIKGLSNRIIGEQLFISTETVRSHRKSIVTKAGARNIEEIRSWILEAHTLFRR